MSKKTQEIRSIFQELGSLQKRIENLKSQAPELEEKNSREIDEISFNLAQNLTKLEFWFNSLYAYNGKSKSVAKKLSSRQNGKKNNAPPPAKNRTRRKNPAFSRTRTKIHRQQFAFRAVARRNKKCRPGTPKNNPGTRKLIFILGGTATCCRRALRSSGFRLHYRRLCRRQRCALLQSLPQIKFS